MSREEKNEVKEFPFEEKIWVILEVLGDVQWHTSKHLICKSFTIDEIICKVYERTYDEEKKPLSDKTIALSEEFSVISQMNLH